MIVFPQCKINLGLQILEKREDGFHNIETIFYPINWRDVVEIIPSTTTGRFSSSGIKVDGNETSNLCLKAYHLLKKDFPLLLECNIHLHKNIPIGAGLGGGSSDASAVLSLLNSMFNLGISLSQLETYAAILGSDCPFFIHSTPMLAKGKGEILSPINLALSHYSILLINPGIHINTGWAFSQLNLKNKKTDSLEDIINQPIDTWQKALMNDFELPIFESYPAIKEIKQQLIDAGALYAAMSGSGSSVFGIFEKKIELKEKLPSSYVLHWS